MIEAAALSRLLQLASPMLPVGAYSYSQGLEWAIEEGSVHDGYSLQCWVTDVMKYSLAGFELPILWRLCEAWHADDQQRIHYWNSVFCAGRDTAESYAETLQMGYSLCRLLTDLAEDEQRLPDKIPGMKACCFPAAYACATTIWKIPTRPAVQAYLWSWLENQVSVALKAVPLGQTDGQKILLRVSQYMPEMLERVSMLGDNEISNFSFGLSLASAQHESQYSRMFRS